MKIISFIWSFLMAIFKASFKESFRASFIILSHHLASVNILLLRIGNVLATYKQLFTNSHIIKEMSFNKLIIIFLFTTTGSRSSKRFYFENQDRIRKKETAIRQNFKWWIVDINYWYSERSREIVLEINYKTNESNTSKRK